MFQFLILLSWTQTEGGCCETSVIFDGVNKVVPPGDSLSLSCEFRCLETQHLAQLWRNRGHEDGVCLVNASSIRPNLTLVLHIGPATEADSGRYSCETHPPNALSHMVLVQVIEGTSPAPSGDPSPPDSPTPTLTTPYANTLPCDSTQQGTRAGGLLGQMWWWLLVAKATVLLHTLIYLAAKYH